MKLFTTKDAKEFTNVLEGKTKMPILVKILSDP
jgi:hypothetical protein